MNRGIKLSYLKKIINNKKILYSILFILLIIIHLLIKTNTNDDIWFKNVIKNISDLPNYLISRYNSWTSRLIIESLLIILLKLPKLVWCLLNTLMIFLLVYDIDNLFSKKNNKMLVLSLICLYSFIDMSSAGWYATTLNYLWPLSLGLYSLIPIKNHLISKTDKLYKYILYFLSLIYACNQEQMCLIIFSIYLLFTIYFIYKKNISKFIILQLIISFISLIFILTCPGNNLRNISETQTWYPAFENFNLISKAFIGIITTTYLLFYKSNFIILLLSLIIPISIFKKYNNKLYRIISLIPIIFYIIEIMLKSNINISIIYNIFNCINVYSIPHNEIELTLANYCAFILCIVYYLSILISIIISFKNKEEKYLLIIIYIIGLISRFMIGLSSTIYASGMRTFIFLDFSLLIISYYFIQELNLNIKYKKVLKYVIIIFDILNIIFVLK